MARQARQARKEAELQTDCERASLMQLADNAFLHKTEEATRRLRVMWNSSDKKLRARCSALYKKKHGKTIPQLIREGPKPVRAARPARAARQPRQPPVPAAPEVPAGRPAPRTRPARPARQSKCDKIVAIAQAFRPEWERFWREKHEAESRNEEVSRAVVVRMHFAEAKAMREIAAIWKTMTRPSRNACEPHFKDAWPNVYWANHDFDVWIDDTQSVRNSLYAGAPEFALLPPVTPIQRRAPRRRVTGPKPLTERDIFWINRALTYILESLLGDVKCLALGRKIYTKRIRDRIETRIRGQFGEQWTYDKLCKLANKNVRGHVSSLIEDHGGVECLHFMLMAGRVLIRPARLARENVTALAMAWNALPARRHDACAYRTGRFFILPGDHDTSYWLGRMVLSYAPGIQLKGFSGALEVSGDNPNVPVAEVGETGRAIVAARRVGARRAAEAA